MGRSKYLEPRAKEYIIDQIRERGEMDKDEIRDLIRPHFQFDYQQAKEQAINRYANQLISQIRDDSGVRTCFNIRGADTVVHVETCRSLGKVQTVQEQLEKQIIGTMASYRKTTRRVEELQGQLSLFQNANHKEAAS